MISSSVLTPIRVTRFTVILFVLSLLSLPILGKETNKEDKPKKKIEIDSSPRKYQDIDSGSEKPSIMKISKKVTISNETNQTLKLFQFYLKSIPNICPCNSELVALELENDEKRIEFLEFLESEENPIKITENSDRLLESIIKKEIDKIRQLLTLQKKQSLEEIRGQQEKLIQEMIKRALLELSTRLDSIVKDKSTYETQLKAMTKKVDLMENIDATHHLKLFITHLKVTFQFYVKLFMLGDPIHKSLAETLWKYVPDLELNEVAEQNFSENSDNISSGLKLVIQNGSCLANESEAMQYLRFLDFIWTSSDKQNLYDQHKNKVIWVYKPILNLHLFQNLFNELNDKDIHEFKYFNIYSKLYNLIIEARIENSDVIIKEESEALELLLNFINIKSEKLFISEEEKEEYLLIKTILFKRLDQMHKEKTVEGDKVDGKVVVDKGLPLSFYVKRKEDRGLLKWVVQKNQLNVNLNILKYNIDQLKTHEEFLSKGRDVLYEYLDLGLAQDVPENDLNEIYNNLNDLLSKIDKSTDRGYLLRIYSIRFVYYRFHFDYQNGLEKTSKRYGIINMKRMPYLREILEIALSFVSDKDFERTQTVFKAVQTDEFPLEGIFDEISLFLQENSKEIFERMVEPAVDGNASSLISLCQMFLQDFKMFVPEEKNSIANEIMDKCNGVKDFHEITSFRRKYFFFMIKWISLSRSFYGYSQKKHLSNEYVEIYSSILLFREFGPMLSVVKHHYALEYDFFMNRESIEPKYLVDVQDLCFPHRYKYFDIIKITNLYNLLPQKDILFKTAFTFIYFKKMTHVLRFFNLKEKINHEFFETIYPLFQDIPKYYHLNNVYLLLRLQFHQDSSPDQDIQSRLLTDYKSINVFNEDQIPDIHFRSQVLASRIAVVYFYAIFLQSCLERQCSKVFLAEKWPDYDELLQTILTNEDNRIMLYFFTDYLYDNMDTSLFQNDFETKEYSHQQFIKESENLPKHIYNRRILTSWAVEYLISLNYTNSPARYLENALYDYFKELLKGRYFDKANEYKELMIRNTLPFHRRNGHKVFSDMHRKFLGGLENNPKIPSDQNMDLMLFNCISEFVAYMNSPIKKYHEFDEEFVNEKLEHYIIGYFKTKGLLYNENMYMPKETRHLNISNYIVTGIVSLFSIFDFSLEKYFKPEIFTKLIQSIEFVSWAHFTVEARLTSLKKVDLWVQTQENAFTKIRKEFKTHELNNLVVQNFEGFFRPICQFENAYINSRFVDNSKSLDKMESTVGECLEIARKSGLTDAKIILFKLIKSFYMPQKYYQESVVIFENDPIPDWLEKVKKLFSKMTLVAQDLIGFFEFAQMIQKVLSSQAKVINSNFQKFLNELVSQKNLDDLTAHLDTEVSEQGLLNVSNKLLPEGGSYVDLLKQYYKNTVMYDVLTLITIDKDTFSQNKKLWNYDFFHLLNRKSNYSAFLTNLFQNYSQSNPAPMHTLYFLVCKFKLNQLLKQKADQGKVLRESMVDSNMSANSIKKLQEEITMTESPKFNAFMNTLISNEVAKEKFDNNLVSDLFYFKTINVDINMVDMSVFEMSDEYAINIVEDIRDILENSSKIDQKELKPILEADNGLRNNLGFYYQEVTKLKGYVDRYGDIEDKFDATQDKDLVNNHVQYLKDYVDLFENKFGLSLSEDETVMYQRNLKTVLFKFDTKVVF